MVSTPCWYRRYVTTGTSMLVSCQLGRIGDKRMFDRSPLSNNLLLRADMFSRGEHILGDGAYTLTDKVMTPYIHHRNSTPRQRTHNLNLSSARAGVERSFALSRSKHRRLKKLPMRNHEYVIDHITSCLVLHNFIMLEGEEAEGLPYEPRRVVNDEAHLLALTGQSMAAETLKRGYIAQLLHP